MAGRAIDALVRKLRGNDDEVRRKAAIALGEYGQAASDAVPALVEALRDRPVFWEAAEALGKIGQPAVPSLIVALNDNCNDMRRRAVVALGMIGAAASEAVSSLMKALQDEDSRVRKEAVHTLKRIGPSAVPYLVRALEDRTFTYKESVKTILMSFREAAAAAVWVLGECIKSESIWPRNHAGETLVKIGRPAVPVLVDLLHHDNYVIRRNCAWWLGEMESVAFEAVKGLEGLLRDEHEQVREEAAKAILRIVKTAEAVDSGLSVRYVSNKMVGLELMGEEAYQSEAALTTFRKLGQYLVDQGHKGTTVRFSFQGLKAVFGLTDKDKTTTIQAQVDKASTLLRRYFRDFEGVKLDDDSSKPAKESKTPYERRILDTPGSGMQRAICEPWGWRAWELTCEFLDRVEVARNESKPKRTET